MIIKPLEQYDRELYAECAKEYGTVFNSLDWLLIFGDKVQIYGIYNKGGELTGGFHLYKEKKLGFSLYCDPPFTPTIGPFLKVESTNPVSIMDTWKKLLSSLSDFIESMPYLIISLSLDRRIVDTQPFIWKKFKVIPGYTYLVNLSLSVDEIWSKMSSERRKNINKGLKDGLVTTKLDNFEIIKSLVVKSFTRQRMIVSESYLDKILFKFSNNCNSFAFVTSKNGNPIGGTFCVYDNNRAYYLLGGYDSDKKHHGAGTLSMWESIKYARNLGLKYFDFEGSMIPQIEKYLRGFGGELSPFFRINKAIIPIEIILKFYKRQLF
ncbi:MAG: GNAT family N-acetyltransferase [Candidatus Scalindua sp.]|nr:GNAT family N-acetyltransferase [Candidatus Scalindua sp.]